METVVAAKTSKVMQFFLEDFNSFTLAAAVAVHHILLCTSINQMLFISNYPTIVRYFQCSIHLS
jgi:hypothetical protein